MGIRVQIHSQEEPPTIDQLGFGAAPGYQTFVSCQQQQVSLPPPRQGPQAPPSPTPSTSEGWGVPHSSARQRGDPHIVPGASVTNQLQLSFLPPPWGDCSSASLDPDFELEPSDPLGPPSPSAGPQSPYSLMGCRLACETRYVARKCGCRMMHMPGKGLVGAEEGVPGQARAKGARAGAVPAAVSSPTTPRRRASVQPPAVQGLRQPGPR